jgi:hypothetical protein
VGASNSLPMGGKHVFLKLHNQSAECDNLGALHLKQSCSTVFGRIIPVEDQGLATMFETVNDSVSRAFTEEIVRLQNPIILLEHGMQNWAYLPGRNDVCNGVGYAFHGRGQR